MNQRLGVCLIGSNGAISTTVVAGVALMRKGLSPKRGMLTETPWVEGLQLTSLDNLVFSGWDLREENAYEAALSHKVIPKHLLDLVRDDISVLKPWPATASKKFLHSMVGQNILHLASIREELAKIEQDLELFKQKQNLDRVVMVNLTSTEKYTEITEVHQTLAAFEAGLDSNDDRISPAMKYLYVALKTKTPHVNFTPSLSNIPALLEMSLKNQVPIAGEDGKTGQTLLKTAIAPVLSLRDLYVNGWYSTNILGNNDGLVLNDPESNKTKITSKKSVLDKILGYPVEDHQVHIHYYKPRGDSKESWDNIDIAGFLDVHMQIKVNFMCKDSILAAPLIIDLARLIDLANRQGRSGIQEQLSVFFKAPYHESGVEPEHNLFTQAQMLKSWLKN